jgi:hypothetical protein
MEKKLHWLSTFGEIDVEEHRFLKAGKLLRPFCVHAGVKCRGYSGPLQRRITDFGAEKSFAKAARQFKEHYGVEVPAGAIRVITEGHGERMLRNAQPLAGASKADEVEQLIAETDGSMIPRVQIEENAVGDRRKTRQVSWKEARLSLVYAAGSVQPMFAVTTGSPEQAGAQLAACAKRAGLGAHTRVHGVGDGAPWIAEQMEEAFGAQGGYLIDFYHLCDYLGAASKRCAAEPKAWFDSQKARMKAGATWQVLKELLAHIEPPEVEEKDAPVRACYRYIKNRPDQFDYPRALAADLPIGSGQIESAHRYVIQERLKIPGAWWKLENADKMLALREVRANGDWKHYWDSAKAA